MQADRLRDRARQYVLLMRLHRPIGILLLLWPMLWALWIASSGNPQPLVLVVLLLGVVVMRSAGCVINDYADRDFDPYVRRTRERPIAAGRVTPEESIGLFLGLCVIAFGLVLLLNGLTIVLSLIALTLAITYPFVKRYTHLPQLYLGIAFGWAVPMAFAAQTGQVPAVAWLLLLAAVLWALVYDTMYAMVDREDDVQIGVKSTAVLFGQADRAIIAGVQTTLFVLLALIGQHVGLGFYYYLGLIAAALFALYQQHLIRDRQPQHCFQAFLNNNWLGAAIFMGIFLDYLAGQ
ncbi:MAG: 4-hydroxybenzoate octaprenyltransferase [Gammaproteobacteria bacterium]